MKNFEFYKEDILRIVNNNTNFGLLNNEIADCDKISCSKCEFRNYYGTCHAKTIKWLYEEHTEKPKLTKKERLFCELMETGWIARDADGSIGYYGLHPTRLISVWDRARTSINFLISDSHNLDSYKAFSFVKWEDKELWSIEDLLQLEVEE